MSPCRSCPTYISRRCRCSASLYAAEEIHRQHPSEAQPGTMSCSGTVESTASMPEIDSLEAADQVRDAERGDHAQQQRGERRDTTDAPATASCAALYLVSPAKRCSLLRVSLCDRSSRSQSESRRVRRHHAAQAQVAPRCTLRPRDERAPAEKAEVGHEVRTPTFAKTAHPAHHALGSGARLRRCAFANCRVLRSTRTPKPSDPALPARATTRPRRTMTIDVVLQCLRRC